MFYLLIESNKGISSLHSHETVLETLASQGSSYLITKVFIHYGFTNILCVNNLGYLFAFPIWPF